MSGTENENEKCMVRVGENDFGCPWEKLKMADPKFQMINCALHGIFESMEWKWIAESLHEPSTIVQHVLWLCIGFALRETTNQDELPRRKRRKMRHKPNNRSLSSWSLVAFVEISLKCWHVRTRQLGAQRENRTFLTYLSLEDLSTLLVRSRAPVVAVVLCFVAIQRWDVRVLVVVVCDVNHTISIDKR